MNIKRIILSLGIIAVVGAVAVAGTQALFTDVESSEANTFAAGEVNIETSSISHNYTGDGVDPDEPEFNSIEDGDGFSFALDDIKPLDSGDIDYVVENVGNSAHICAMVEVGAEGENLRNEAEILAGDITGGTTTGGELGQFMSFDFGGQSGALTDIAGMWFNVAGPVASGESVPATISYCFGDWSGSNCVDNPFNNDNLAQTDSLGVNIVFQAVQSRNNAGFDCSMLNVENTVVEVNESELIEGVAKENLNQYWDSDQWFFYNDTNDTIMDINQFAAEGGINEMVTGPNGVEAVQMTLDEGTATPEYDGKTGLPRYNIATYKYNDVKLSDINVLTYRIYDADPSSQTPFLHFNVDLLNNDTWQGRLVQVPTGVNEDEWTTVDALAGTWTKTSGNWPAGLTSNGSLSGSTARTWAEIVADYPNAETRSTDAFFGVRVGHPGPIGETGYVDWINFDGEITDFVE